MSEAPDRESLGRAALMLGLAVAGVALIGVVLLVVTPDDGLLETPLDPLFGSEPNDAVLAEPVWGTPGPMQGALLDPGACETGRLVTDPSGLGDARDAASWPTGLALWLRSDRGVVRQAGTGGISQWRDLSPAGRDLTAIEGEEPAVWVQHALGCLPAVRFAGLGRLARPDTLGLAPDQPRTFVVVSRLRDVIERGQLLSQGEPGSLDLHVGLEVNTWRTAGERFGLYVLGNSFDAERGTHRGATTQVLSIASLSRDRPLHHAAAGGGSIEWWIDGQAAAPTRRSGPGRPVTGLPETASTSIGRFAGPGRYAHRGDVFEVQVYGRRLDDDERRAVERILADRYGIATEDRKGPAHDGGIAEGRPK